MTRVDAHLICLLSLPFLVSSLYFLKKQQQQKDGEKKPLKRTKRKNPAQNQRWILFRGFFIFIFFICRWQEDGIPSAQRILSLHAPRRPQPSGCQRLPATRLHSPDATAPPSRHLTWLGGTFPHWSCSGPHRPLGGGPRCWGNGSAGQRQVPLGVREPGDLRRSVQAPPPPEMKVTSFLCWAFASASVSVRVPSLPPHRDLEEWGGEAVGLRVLVGVCVCI